MSTASPQPPVKLIEPQAPPLPLVLSVPHAGREYPPDFHYQVPLPVLRTLEDAYVDRLYAAAPGLGATVVVARFPRSYIDPNRHEADVDPGMLDGPWPIRAGPASRGAPWQRLFWARVYGRGEIYARKLPVAEALERVQGCHRPFHEALGGAIEALRSRFGLVWHLDCHSMPSVGQQGEPDEGRRRPDMVLGDWDAVTCEPELAERVQAQLVGAGYTVQRNGYYKGGEIVRRYGRPSSGIHSLQIELNRDLYLDGFRVEPSPAFGALSHDLQNLLGTLAAALRARLGLDASARG